MPGILDGGMDIKITQNGALNETWWSIEISELPEKCQLNTKQLTCQISMQFSCRTIMMLEVAIVVANQRRDDVNLRTRSLDLLKCNWLNQIPSPGELKRAEYSQRVPRLCSDQLVWESEIFQTPSLCLWCNFLLVSMLVVLGWGTLKTVGHTSTN